MRAKRFCGEFWKKAPPLLEGERKFIWMWTEWTFNPFIASLQKYDMKNIPLNSY
jgi:hypothetical protein